MSVSNQVESTLRTLLGTIGPAIAALLIGLGVAESTAGVIVTAIIAIVPPVVAVAWGWYQNRDKAIIAAAAAIPGVTKIKIDPSVGVPTVGAIEAAADPKLPNVKRQE